MWTKDFLNEMHSKNLLKCEKSASIDSDYDGTFDQHMMTEYI